MELENSASQDAVVREKIANLPAEVQDVSLLEKIEGTQPMQLKFTSFYKLACTVCTAVPLSTCTYKSCPSSASPRKIFIHITDEWIGQFLSKVAPPWLRTYQSFLCLMHLKKLAFNRKNHY